MGSGPGKFNFKDMKKIIAFAGMLAVAFCAAAQPQGQAQFPPRGEGQGPRPMENQAQMKADRMKQELQLTDKQYKKVLKVYQKEEKAMHPESEGGMQGGPGGMPGGMGGMQGGMGGPGGGQMGGPGMGQGGQRPQGPPPGMQQLSEEEMEKILAKKEKKLRKILSSEQFNAWSAAHPEEFTLMMPELEGEKIF